ncbi:MAG: carboxypeptidase-like regulatory domain-containing protein [Saprospiraceae bacterium]|nr:carboxypeptidase-like regulatory domain-containing protein [Saprospiraceae bacterium]
MIKIRNMQVDFSKIKFIALMISVGLSAALHAQDKKIASQIVNEEGEGIAYVAIGIPEKHFGTNTFEDGSFSLPIERKYMEDSLLISAIGYERKKVSYQVLIESQPAKIILKVNPIALPAITIRSTRLADKRIGTKRKGSRNNFSLGSPLKGLTVAMRFGDIKKPLRIKEVSVSIGKLNMDSVQVRCRVFAVDPETGLPGKDLLQENLIQTSSTKRAILRFVLEEAFWLDQDFYVGFEWVMTKQQYAQLQAAQERYPVEFLKDIYALYPDLKPYINENKRVHFRDSTNKVLQEKVLTREQTALLRARDAAAPQLQFKILMKGQHTYCGLPLTHNWERIPHEALISLIVQEEP